MARAVDVRNVLVDEYIDVDDGRVRDNLQRLADLDAFVSPGGGLVRTLGGIAFWSQTALIRVLISAVWLQNAARCAGVTIGCMAARAENVAAGVVLAGGRSSRMGTPKAALEWHGSTLLRRTLGVLVRAVDGPLLVVCAPGQLLPEVPSQVDVVEDPEEGRGPLQGIAAGLAALTGRAQIAFVCSTDLPFLHPVFVHRVLGTLTGDIDVVLPVARGFPQPLAAAYRVTLAPLVAKLVAAGDLRLVSLFRRCATLRLDDAALLADPALAAVDPALDSVVNVNSPDDYRTARRHPAPQITVQSHGALARNGQRGPRTVHAATLAGAAAAVGLVLDRHVVPALNGDQISRDGDVPLASGDTVAFLHADAGR